MVKTSPKPKTIFPFVPDTVAPAGSAATAATMTASSTRKRTRPPMRNLISPPLPGAKAEEGTPAAVLGPNRDSLIPSLRKFKQQGRLVAEPPEGDSRASPITACGGRLQICSSTRAQLRRACSTCTRAQPANREAQKKPPRDHRAA